MYTAFPISLPEHELGEGPVYRADGTFACVDVPTGRIRLADTTADRLRWTCTVTLGRPVGAVVPAVTGGWVAAAGAGFLWLDENGVIQELDQPEAGRAGIRMNDGKCDSAGRFWAGSTVGPDATAASLYRLDPDGSVHRMLKGVSISNGIGWSPDDRIMCYVDSGRGTLDTFEFDPIDGTLGRRRVLVEFKAPTVPDGLAVDDTGAIWLALWDGAAVHRYTPHGSLDSVVHLPVDRPTSCCFGANGLLYVTTARTEQPHAGAVFAVRTTTTGRPAVPYAGMC